MREYCKKGDWDFLRDLSRQEQKSIMSNFERSGDVQDWRGESGNGGERKGGATFEIRWEGEDDPEQDEQTLQGWVPEIVGRVKDK